MKRADIELRWKTYTDSNGNVMPACDQKVKMRVDSIRKQSGGLFGMKRAASIAGNMTNGMEVRGVIIDSEKDLNGKSIVIVLPKHELPTIADGDEVLVSILGGDRIVALEPAG